MSETSLQVANIKGCHRHRRIIQLPTSIGRTTKMRTIIALMIITCVWAEANQITLNGRAITGKGHGPDHVAHTMFFANRGMALYPMGKMNYIVEYSMKGINNRHQKIAKDVVAATKTFEKVTSYQWLDYNTVSGIRQDFIEMSNYLVAEFNTVSRRLGFQDPGIDRYYGNQTASYHNHHHRGKRGFFATTLFTIGGYIAGLLSSTSGLATQFASPTVYPTHGTLHNYDMDVARNMVHHVEALHVASESEQSSIDLLSTFTDYLAADNYSTGKFVRILAIFNKLRWMISDFGDYVQDLNDSFKNIAQGKLDLGIFSLQQAKDVFTGMTKAAIEKGYELLPQSYLDLQEMASEMYAKNNDTIVITIDVPLISSYSKMSVIEYKPVPTAAADGIYMQARPETHDILAINQEAGIFTVMKTSDFNNCWQEKRWRVCEDVIAFWKEDDVNLDTEENTDLCIYALMKQHKPAINRLCVTEKTAPRTIHEALGNGVYLYASHNQTTGILKCTEHNKIQAHPVRAIHEVDLIKIDDGCQLHVGSMILTSKVSHLTATTQLNGELHTLRGDVEEIFPGIDFEEMSNLQKELEERFPHLALRKHDTVEIHKAIEDLRIQLGRYRTTAHKALNLKQAEPQELLDLIDKHIVEKEAFLQESKIYHFVTAGCIAFVVLVLFFLFFQSQDFRKKIGKLEKYQREDVAASRDAKYRQ